VSHTHIAIPKYLQQTTFRLDIVDSFCNTHFISFFYRWWTSRYHSSCSFFTWKTNIPTTKHNVTVTPSKAK